MNLLLGTLNAALLILNTFISFEISYTLQGSFALYECHNGNKKVTFLCTTVQRSVAASDQFNRMQELLFDNESHWICLHHYSITAVLQGVCLSQIFTASLGTASN